MSNMEISTRFDWRLLRMTIIIPTFIDFDQGKTKNKTSREQFFSTLKNVSEVFSFSRQIRRSFVGCEKIPLTS